MANEPAGPVYETGRYRKKPVVIEARQLPATASPAEAHAIYQWVEATGSSGASRASFTRARVMCLRRPTRGLPTMTCLSPPRKAGSDE